MKSTKNKSGSSSASSKPVYRVLGMGNIDLTYTLNLSEEDVAKYKIDLDKVNSLEDIGFLEDAKNLWVKIFISSNNPTLSTLIYLNRASDNKVFVEYLCYKLPCYDEKEKPFGEMFTSVNEINFLFINHETALFPNKGTCNITFVIKFNENSKSFSLGNNTQSAEENKEEEKKEDTFIDKIHFDCKAYEYFFTNIEDAFIFDSIDDYIELITGLKMKYNSNIMIRYTDITGNFSSHEEMMKLNRIYLLTDTFIIETKNAYALFNQHYKTFSPNKKNNSDLSEKRLNDYFISTIACSGQLSLINSKICILYDDALSRTTIIEVPATGRSTVLKYDIRPYPKINHTNVDLVEKYKSTLKESIDFYTNIYLGGFLSKFIPSSSGKNKGVECLYPSYLAGSELIKRILDIKVRNVDLPTKLSFYVIRLNKEDIQNYIKQYYLDRKEGKFVLDCTNPQKAKMKAYVPLFDNNLHSFFGKNTIKKELKEKGFINTNGFVYFDPLYREEMRPKIKKRTLKELDVKEQQKMIVRKTMEESNPSSKRILNSLNPTIKKIVTEPVDPKKTKTKHLYFKGLRAEYQKCNYCDLKEKGKRLDEIEEEKRRSSQLRK